MMTDLAKDGQTGQQLVYLRNKLIGEAFSADTEAFRGFMKPG